jgi:hypothetical protein
LNGEATPLPVEDPHRFGDFTVESYRRLLGLARGRYRFRTFADFRPDEGFVLWRHDVDVSMQRALRLARVEAEEGVVATYFVHLQSRFYHLLEPPVLACALEILALGHMIGLHFESELYPIAGASDPQQALERALRRDRAILEDRLGTPIGAFSFHNPGPATDGCRAEIYAGMVNAYSDYFRDRVGYCSDSNGHWRRRRLEDVLRVGEDRQLQVLTHPEWWQETPMSPRERIERAILGRAQATRDYYDGLLAAGGRENIGARRTGGD